MGSVADASQTSTTTSLAGNGKVIITFELYFSHAQGGYTASYGQALAYEDTEAWFDAQAGAAVKRNRSEIVIGNVPSHKGCIFDCAPNRLVLVLEVS